VALSGIRYRHPGAVARCLDTVDLDLAPGSFTVLTGPVGSGKTTLLRVLLGLADPAGLEGGEVHWNGRRLADPGAHMVPPRVAFVPQVPRLFSETLRDNVALGLALEPGALAAVLATVQLDRDLAAMPLGVETMVGARGTRLSGGQVQRVAAARALVRRPALLVLDDLSSALDVATELAVWDQLLAERTATCLAVSHRPAVLARADAVVVLEGGRVVTDDAFADGSAGGKQR
jgi:ATP-binding cassette subfamily B protein